MKEETKQNLKNKNTWTRVLFMVLYVILLGVARIVLAVTLLFQVIVALITGTPNSQALRFGKQLSIYIYEILLFLTFNSEEHPFPLSEWPSLPKQIEKKKEVKKQKEKKEEKKEEEKKEEKQDEEKQEEEKKE